MAHRPSPASVLLTVAGLLFVASPFVLFGGFWWIGGHHYGDGTGDLFTPFGWAGLDVLVAAVVLALGLSASSERARRSDAGGEVGYDGRDGRAPPDGSERTQT